MTDRLTAAVVGCGWMGVDYVEWLAGHPDTDLVGLVDSNPERLREISERFGVGKTFPDVKSLLGYTVPDVVAVVTPTKYFKDVVVACAEAGVKGIMVEKPIGGLLSDVDEMIEACESRGTVFGGGRVQRAIKEVQQVAGSIRDDEYGTLVGASVHNWGGGIQISGGGNQHVSVLRLLTGVEVSEVVAWAQPQDVLESDTDHGLTVNAVFTLSNGIKCPVFGMATPLGALDGGVQVWSDRALISTDSFASPKVYVGFDTNGARVPVETPWEPKENQDAALDGSISSFLAAVSTGSELWISARDLRAALEVAIAAKGSALLGSVPIALPLEDRSLSLYPSRTRWLGQAFG